MKFCQKIDVDDHKVDLEGQGQRSRSPGQKKRYFRSHLTILQVIFEVKGHVGQGQRSHGSRSKVKVKVKNVISGHIWPSYR